MAEHEEISIHDILKMGAGPSCLALAARLREPTPSALFTDSEHQRYHWMRSSPSSCRNIRHSRTSRRQNTAPDRLLSGPTISTSDGEDALDIAVLGAHSDNLMGSWNERFKQLQISHFRSAMFFHPHPRDRDGLLSFAYSNGAPEDGELKEIRGVVGKGLSKHQRKKVSKNGKKGQQETTYLDERQRHDCVRPSQKLFKSYCEDIVKR
jgi:hypothetical protein